MTQLPDESAPESRHSSSRRRTKKPPPNMRVVYAAVLAVLVVPAIASSLVPRFMALMQHSIDQDRSSAICPSCQRPIDVAAASCPHCGLSISESRQQQQQAEAAGFRVLEQLNAAKAAGEPTAESDSEASPASQADPP